MKLQRTKNTLRNMIWAYLYKAVGIILPFIYRTVMIRILGADYLGVNSLFTSVLQVLNLSELGFGSAVVFSMYKPISENNDAEICALLHYYRRVYLCIGCVIMGLGLIITPFIRFLINGEYPSDINIYFVYIIFLTNTAISYFLFSYREAILNAYQRNDVLYKILLVISIFRYTFEIVVILLTHQYYLSLFVELISTILNNILIYIITKRLYPQYSPKGEITKSERGEIKNNVTALMFHKVGGIVLNSADTIVLSAFMGVVIVANYSNYYYIMNAISSIIITGFSGMTAGIGNSFVTENTKKNRDNFNKILFFNAWVVGWCSTCFLCLYQDFIRLWVGEEYMFSDFIVILFVIYFFVHDIRRTIITFRDGAGMWIDNRLQPIVSAIFNLITNIILVQIIGVAGVLISSIVSMVLIDIPWETHVFCKRIGMKDITYFSKLVYYFIITTVTAGICFFVASFINFSLIINLLFKGILCIILPNIIFCIIFWRTDEFKFFINFIKEVLSKSKNITS